MFKSISPVEHNELEFDIITLNIGGIVFETTQSTLCCKINDKSHFFHNLLSQKGLKVAKDKKGRVFIDRDGTLFHHILSYLRNHGKIQFCSFPTSNADLIRQLKVESDYYGLLDLKDHFRSVLYSLYLENNVFSDNKWTHFCKNESHYNCFVEANSNEISPQFVQDVDETNHQKYFIYQFVLNQTGNYSNHTFQCGFYYDAFNQYFESFPKIGYAGLVTLWIDVLSGHARWYDEEKEVKKMSIRFDRRIRIFVRWGVSKEIEFIPEGNHPQNRIKDEK